MTRPVLLLFKKEFRQNIILYLLPAPFSIAWIYMRLFAHAALPSWTGALFGIALPFTLAIAYGLQAFDVEEDAQTRDFLLVRPFSVQRIIGEKFLIGLGILLLWVILFLRGASDGVFWPSVLAVNSWIPTLVLLGATLAYSVSFVTGLWIIGPRKLIVATLVSLLGLAWGFFTFSGIVTFSLLNTVTGNFPMIQEILFYLTGLIIIYIFIGLGFNISAWLLMQRPRMAEAPYLLKFLLAFLFIPILALTLNFSIRPLIRSTNFDGLELFGLKPAFWVVDGVWQPGGDQIAFIGADNSIGLGRLGQEPVVIYHGKLSGTPTIKELNWSPNSQMLSFIDNGQVYIWALKNKKALWIGKGTHCCWSSSSTQLLFSNENIPPRQLDVHYGNQVIYTIDFQLADLQKSIVEPSHRIQSTGSSWYWDSPTDSFLVYDQLGQLTFYQSNKPKMVYLPAFPIKKEVAFWGRFYQQPNRPGHCILVLYTVKSPYNGKLTNYIARFYDIDISGTHIKYLEGLTRDGISNLILNPDDGTCLWGQGSAYVKNTLNLRKEGVK